MHLAPPGSMEAYYQEVGRAGRDGEDAVGLLMVSPGDMPLRRRLIESDASVRREYEALRRVAEAVRGLSREGAPPALQDRLRGIGTARRPATILRWAAPLAAAAVVVVAVMLAVKEDQAPQDFPDEARAEKTKDSTRDERKIEKGFANEEKLAGKVQDEAGGDAPAPTGAPKDDSAPRKPSKPRSLSSGSTMARSSAPMRQVETPW